MYDFWTKNIKNTQSYKNKNGIFSNKTFVVLKFPYSIFSIIASPMLNANLICKLVKIILNYVMHIATDIKLYQEKYI